MTRARLAILLLVLVGIGIGLYFYVKPQTRFITASRAISDDEVLLVTRRNEDNATYFWVELHDKIKGVRWITNTGNLEGATSLGFSGLAADKERVYVMLEDDSLNTTRSELWALQRETGDVVWKTPISILGTPYSDFLFVQGDTLIALNGSVSVIASAFDTKTGRPLWQNSLGNTGQAMLLNDSIYFTSSLGVKSLRLSDGTEGQKLEKNNCFLGDSFFVRDQGELSTLALEKGASPQKIRDLTDTRVSSLGECWRYQAHIVVMNESYPNTTITAISERTGEVIWSIFLENIWVLSQHRSFAPVTQYPRYVPIELLTRNGDKLGEHQLAILDLEEGKVSAMQPPHFVSSSISYIKDKWLVANGPQLIWIDGQTGGLISAWKAKWDLGMLNSAAITGGLLWLPGYQWATSAKLPWAIFDITKGKPTQTRGEMDLQEVTDNWKPIFSQTKSLGAPAPQSAPTSSPSSQSSPASPHAPASTQATSLP